MIKVNLAKKGSGSSRRSGGGGSGGGALSAAKNPFSGLTGIFNKPEEESSSEESKEVNRTLLTRLAILSMGPLMFFGYEQVNLPPKRANIGKLRTELEVKTRKNQEAAGAVTEIQRFEKEQIRLQSQIGAIEAIKKDRLREVRVLDYIQREIPEKVWLQRLDLVENRLSITGFATADNELTTFMEGLQRSAYLKEVNLVRSNEAPVADFGLVKKFEITCLVEKSQ